MWVLLLPLSVVLVFIGLGFLGLLNAVGVIDIPFGGRRTSGGSDDSDSGSGVEAEVAAAQAVEAAAIQAAAEILAAAVPGGSW